MTAPAPESNIITIAHGRASLALHLLREGWGRPLLLLHGLGEQSPSTVPDHLDGWTGPVYALDFVGHGRSTIPKGGGYTAEVLMGDVDAVIAHLGQVTVHGRGLGAYIGLLIAGGRPSEVRGVILADGPGLVGGGIRPGSPQLGVAGQASDQSPDPYALIELSRDVRPPDYAAEFVRQALQWSPLDTPIAVCTVVRPEWLDAVVAEPGVVETSIAEALALYDPRPPAG
jgi:pimeloyl-ACP methyl ester carboxylesterase